MARVAADDEHAADDAERANSAQRATHDALQRETRKRPATDQQQRLMAADAAGSRTDVSVEVDEIRDGDQRRERHDRDPHRVRHVVLRHIQITDCS